MFFTQILLIFLLCANSQAKRAVNIYFTSIECLPPLTDAIAEFNCELVPNATTYLAALKTSRNAVPPTFNINLTLSRDISDLKLKYRLLVALGGNPRKFNTYLSEEFDACESMTQRHSNMVLRFLHEQLHTKGNIPLGCPIKKQKPYFLKNISVDQSFLPPYIPRLKWHSTSEIWCEGQKAAIFETFGNIE